MSTNEIDFVVPWVDGQDLDWQKEFKEHNKNDSYCDTTFKRYRDWGLLRYWFRGVEQYAPWVRKIFFVTSGHVPDWLDLNNPKLVVVKHEDYIPSEYLPTFSSHPIEVNMHRIKGLSEKFVYFNDDFFLLDHLKKTDFFRGDLPVDMAGEFPNYFESPVISSIHINNTILINKNFNKRKFIMKNLSKWYNPKYKELAICSLLLSPWSRFVGFYCHHLPQPFLKSTFNEVWAKEYESLHETSLNKFRSRNDVNQYAFKLWQICTGKFYPFNKRDHSELFLLTEENYESARDLIISGKKKVVCINDEGEFGEDFEKIKSILINAFESKLTKSTFER